MKTKRERTTTKSTVIRDCWAALFTPRPRSLADELKWYDDWATAQRRAHVRKLKAAGYR